MRAITGNLDLAIAAFNPFAVRPVEFSTKTTRASLAASFAAISFVRSVDGPSARITSNSPAYCWAKIALMLSSRWRSSLRIGRTTEIPLNPPET